jgi:peptidoglycan/LPS O-acetylase OafA/YrhL
LLATAVTVAAFDFFGADWYLADDTYDIRGVVLCGCFAVVIAAVVMQPSAALFAPLRSAVLQWLGRLSYSLYLWHATIFTILSQERFPDAARPVLVVSKVVLSFLAAWLSYRLIERPLIEYGRRIREHRRLRDQSRITIEAQL